MLDTSQQDAADGFSGISGTIITTYDQPGHTVHSLDIALSWKFIVVALIIAILIR